MQHQNASGLDEVFICPVCSLILKNPMQLTECGHRQCQLCIERQSTTTIVCPRCRRETPKNQVWFDRGFRNDMQTSSITCSLCQWNGLLNNLQGHVDEFHPKCEYCNKQFDSINDLNAHKLSECQLSSHMTTDTSGITTNTDTLPTVPTTHKLNETLNILRSGIDALNDDIHRFTNELASIQVRIQTLIRGFSRTKISVEESSSSLQTIEHEQVDDLQPVSYDGTYVWKITNVREKMMDAQCERQTSIYSPPFYSSPFGYKMCARLYFHGNGEGHRTHMSLFFVLMRSEYDAILTFPFNYKISFCLYDQTPTQQHIMDSFRPDIRSNSFQRPRSEMNIASGIPKFVPLSMIEQEGNPYIHDDMMFVKIIVDFGNMPTIDAQRTRN